MMLRYPCVCCDYLTLTESPPGTWEICPVCGWQDDFVQGERDTVRGGANEQSLREARASFAAFGASDRHCTTHVRGPLPEEFLQHDEAYLERILAGLDVRRRVGFAACCAQRLIGGYEAYCVRAGHDQTGSLARILADIWRFLIGGEVTVETLVATLPRCIELIPAEDHEPWIAEQPHADDAAAAVAYALRTLETGDPREAVWAARRSYEAAVTRVEKHRDPFTDLAAIPNHPYVRAELARQRRDLDDIIASPADVAEVWSRLRGRATHEDVSR